MQGMFGLFASSQMSDRDRMILSPWEKWVKHKRFPVKILVQVLVLLILLVHVYIICQYPPSIRANLKAFREYFLLGDDTEGDSGDNGIWSLEDCFEQLNHTVTMYYNINQVSISNFSYLESHAGSPIPVSLTMWNVTQSGELIVLTSEPNGKVETYNQTLDNPLGPFDPNNLDGAKLRFSMLSGMAQSFYLIDTVFIRGIGMVTNQWHAIIRYTVLGTWVDVDLSLTRQFPPGTLFAREAWISVTLFIFSSFSAFLSLKRIIMGFLVFRRSRDKFRRIPKEKIIGYFEQTRVTPVCLEWNQIPFSIKFEFLSSWHMLSICGDILIMLSQVLRFVDNEDVSIWCEVFTGIGVLILCVNMTKYLEYSMKFYTLILTLKASAARIFRLVLSTLPMFFGYILCGVIVFSPYTDLFSNMDRAGVILFSLLNGDEIHSTFTALEDSYPFTFFSRFYLFSFVALFITAILNLFIFIIEDSYELAKVLSGDIHRSGEESLDYDEILLWENLQLEFNLRHLFDILELSDPPDLGKSKSQKFQSRDLKNVQQNALLSINNEPHTHEDDEGGYDQDEELYDEEDEDENQESKVEEDDNKDEEDEAEEEDAEETTSLLHEHTTKKPKKTVPVITTTPSTTPLTSSTTITPTTTTTSSTTTLTPPPPKPFKPTLAHPQMHSHRTFGKRDLTAEKVESIIKKHQGRFLDDAKKGLLVTQTKFLDAIAKDVEAYLQKDTKT